MAAVPVFWTVKVAVVDWLVNGDAGDHARAEVSVSTPLPVGFCTFTVTPLLVAVTFALLRARAENVWFPLLSVVVSNDML